MPTKTAAQGTASQTDDETIEQTQEGAESTRAQPEKLTAREELFARIDEMRGQALQKDAEYALESGHPMAVQVEAERRAKAPAESGSGAAGDKDDAATDSPVTEGAEADTEAASVPANEELAQHGIVLKNGKPAMKLKVDGKEQLVPLDTARATLQKHTAADARLQQAATERAANERRAAELAAKEAELNARNVRSQPSAQAAVDDQGLKAEAKALVSSLLTDSEDVAAEKLATVLAKTRQAAAPPVNVDEVAAKAAKAVRSELKEEDTRKDLTNGLKQFETQYPAINSDPALFAVADSKTDAISKEHPEWSPSQVMLEAGRQTQEWVDSLRGGAAPITKQPRTTTTSSPTTDRQARKETLRPLPPTRSARATTTKTAPATETPASIVAEMRKSRGQA